MTITTPPTSSSDRWAETLVILSSLPTQTRTVIFNTNLGKCSTAALPSFFESLDWAELERSLAHCNGLRTLELAVTEAQEPGLSLSKRRDLQEIILAKFSSKDFRDTKVRFV